MPSLRIALVSETYPPQINGVSRTLERLVQFLAARGDRVLLLIPRYDAPGPVAAGVDRREFGAVTLPMYKEVVLPFVSPGKVVRELAAFAPDLVHIATEGPLGWAALRAAGGLKLPTVSSYHTNFPQYLRLYGLGLLEGAAWRWLRGFHNRTSRTFCPTPSIRLLLEGKGFRQVRTWGRGVDGDRFHPGKRSLALRRQWKAEEDDVVLIYSGRLAAEKNLEMLMDAWERIPGKGKKLVLVGDGPLRKKLENRGREGVIFAGYRTGEDLAATYASADMFVFPSVTDTFGNVILEGMASGLPAVGFRAPGPQDIIEEGRTGRIVEALDSSALARTLEDLAGDRNLLRQMGRNARTYAESQSWGQILGALREEYAAVLGSDARRAQVGGARDDPQG